YRTNNATIFPLPENSSGNMDSLDLLSPSPSSIAVLSGRNMSLCEMMRRATSAALSLSGLESQETERDLGLPHPDADLATRAIRLLSFLFHSGQRSQQQGRRSTTAGEQREHGDRNAALTILFFLCDAVALRPHLKELLMA
ncbi:hypothetical protein MRX96_050770, partial [Rhipicephalus microplus]